MSFNLQGSALVRNASGQYVQASQSAYLFLDPIGDQQTFTYSYTSIDSTEIMTGSFAAASVSDSVLGFGVDTLINAPGVSIERWSWSINPEYGFVDVLIVRQLAPLPGETPVDFLFLLSPIPTALDDATTTTEGTLAVLNSFTAAPINQGTFAPGNPISLADIPDIIQNINGTGGSDILTGGDGQDWIWPGLGNDTIDGGLDEDVVFYEDLQFGVVANISDVTRNGSPANSVTGGAQFTDAISNVENFHLTQFDDTFYSNQPGGSVVLRAGNDAIQLDGVSRFIIPGSGNDTVTADPNNPSYLSYEADLYDAAGPQTSGIQVQFTDASSGTVQNDGWGGVDTFTGVDKIRGSSQDDVMLGSDGAQFLFGEAGNDTLEGGGGDDFLEGGDGDDELDGGSGNDHLYGGAGNDTIFTGPGNSHVEGGPGDDVIDASALDGLNNAWVMPGTGSNTIIGSPTRWAQRPDGLDLSYQDVLDSGGLVFEVGANGSGTVLSNNAGVVADSFSFASRFRGTAENDTFFGSANPNWEGWEGQAGNDTIDGGDGFDELLYHLDWQSGGNQGVTVDFVAGTAADTFGDTDSFTGIEAVRGTPFSDVFQGNEQIGSIRYRGLDGNDTVIGTSSYDVVDYSRDADYGGALGIVANLLDGSIQDGFGTIDNVSMVDEVRGTEQADIIDARGYANDVRIYGYGGDDQLYGGLGVDIINGGFGNDYINPGDNNYYDYIVGGDGDDTLDFSNIVTGYVGIGYEELPDAISVSINGRQNSGTINKAIGGQDTVISVSSALNASGLGITGTAFSDSFQVDLTAGQWMEIQGRAGIDTYQIDGEGDVRLGFQNSNNGIDVNLQTRIISNDGYGNIETITGSRAVYAVRGTDFDDTIVGSNSNESFILGGGNDTLDGGGGFDRIRFDRPEITSGVTVDLTTGTATGTWNGIEFAHSISGVEDIRGGLGDDVLIGDDGSNRFFGGDGNDYISTGDSAGGFDGYDDILGSNGNDTFDLSGVLNGYAGIWYGDMSEGVSVSVDGALSSAQIDKGSLGVDTVISVSNALGSTLGGFGVIGSNFNDTFNLLLAEDQWMQVRGGAGVDSYVIDGTGSVRLDFRGGENGVNVNLANGVIANDGFGNVEAISGSKAVWEVQGTDFNDTIIGSAANESFILRGGNDSLDGGDGFDRIRFDRPEITAGVTVNLTDGTATGSWNGAAFKHSLTNIESVRGSSFNDIMVDTLSDEQLEGNSGADIFRISGGNDVIRDFQVGVDFLDMSLTGLPAQTIFDAFANAQDDGNGNSVINYGPGNSLELTGVSAVDVRNGLIDPFGVALGIQITNGELSFASSNVGDILVAQIGTEWRFETNLGGAATVSDAEFQSIAMATGQRLVIDASDVSAFAATNVSVSGQGSVNIGNLSDAPVDLSALSISTTGGFTATLTTSPRQEELAQLSLELSNVEDSYLNALGFGGGVDQQALDEVRQQYGSVISKMAASAGAELAAHYSSFFVLKVSEASVPGAILFDEVLGPAGQLTPVYVKPEIVGTLSELTALILLNTGNQPEITAEDLLFFGGASVSVSELQALFIELEAANINDYQNLTDAQVTAFGNLLDVAVGSGEDLIINLNGVSLDQTTNLGGAELQLAAQDVLTLSGSQADGRIITRPPYELSHNGRLNLTDISLTPNADLSLVASVNINLGYGSNNLVNFSGRFNPFSSIDIQGYGTFDIQAVSTDALPVWLSVGEDIRLILTSDQRNSLISGFFDNLHSEGLVEVVGTEGADVLRGTSGMDVLQGLGGDDILEASFGNDVLNGGDGNDTLNPGDNDGGYLGYDIIVGSTGNDTVNLSDLYIGYVGLHYDGLGADLQATDTGIIADVNGEQGTGSVNKGAAGTDTIQSVNNALFSSLGGLGIVGTSGSDTFNLRLVQNQWVQVRSGAGADSYVINGTGDVRLDFRDGANGVDVNLSTGVISNDGFGNAETITGDNSIWEVQGTDFDDSIVGGLANESFILRGGNDTLDGGGGFDRIRFDRPEITDGVTVNLIEGTASGTWNGLAFSHTVTRIEDVRGGSGNDILIGDGGTNRLYGGDGNDFLNPGDNAGGFDGYDDIIASTGDDTIDVSGVSTGYVGLWYGNMYDSLTINIDGVSNTGQISKGDFGTDTIIAVSNALGSTLGGFGVIGSNFNDTFNLLLAEDQWMQVRGGAGVDSYVIDGTGSVRLDFRGGENGVNVNLATGVIANDGFGNVEAISGSKAVWEVQGTDFNDTIIGSAANESFILRGGNDSLDGGDGFDRIRFDRPEITTGVSVDLSAGTASGFWNGVAFSHLITGIEDVRGGAGDDVLKGGDGADRIFGGDGNDILYASFGADIEDGGTGIDTYIIDASLSYIPVINLALGTAYLQGTLPDYSNSVLNIENLTMLGGSDVEFIGSTADNILTGGAGNDTLTGGAGADTFVFRGSFGHDKITDFNTTEDLLEFYAADGAAIDPSTLIEGVDISGNRVLSTSDALSSVTFLNTSPPPSGDMAPISTTVTHRFGQAMSDPEVSTTEIIGGNEVFLREVSSTDAGTVFELVAAPTANIASLDFEFTDNVDLISFQLGAALAGWTIQSNTAVANTVTVSGFGALNGSQDIVAGVETVLATFETVASPDVVVTGIFTNGVAQQDIALRDVSATSKLASVTVHEVANGADAFVFADLAVDLASENAVGSFDALQALRLAVGLTKSDGTAEWHDYFAADINKDGRVGSDDALNILKYAVGLTDGPAADWVFVDSTADYSGVTRQNSGYEEGVLLSDVVTDTTVDFTAILVGDVDGSYIV